MGMSGGFHKGRFIIVDYLKLRGRDEGGNEVAVAYLSDENGFRRPASVSGKRPNLGLLG